MQFRDYAFKEYIEFIDQKPSAKIGVVMAFGREDMRLIARMTAAQLVKWPSIESRPQSRPVGMASPEMPGQRRGTAIIGNSRYMLPAAFATIGYALKSGREVKVLSAEALSPTETNPHNVHESMLVAKPFLDSESDIPGGMKAFFDEQYRKLHRPQNAMIYAFIQPLIVN